MQERIQEGFERRADLHEDPRQTAYRLFHGYGEGLPGLEIDRWGSAVVITHHDEHLPLLTPILEVLRKQPFDCELVIARPRRRTRPPEVLWGAAPPDTLTVQDNGLSFRIEPMAPRNPGLYLDARPARTWILSAAQDRRVLNLFAYTGSLGLSAAAGGARSVTHVEMQKRAMERLRNNHLLNDLPLDGRDLVRADLYPFLRRAARDGRTFDAIILDPPPQVRGKAGRGAAGQDYDTLARLAGSVLAPGGWLLCFFSQYGTSRALYETEVQEACQRTLSVLWRGASGVDHPEADPEAKLRFTAFAAADAASGRLLA